MNVIKKSEGYMAMKDFKFFFFHIFILIFTLFLKLPTTKIRKLNIKLLHDFLDKQKIKNHLLNLSEDFKSKDEFLIKNILETFIEKVTVYNNRVVIDMKIFSMMDMARNGGDDGNRTRVRNYQRHRLLQA